MNEKDRNLIQEFPDIYNVNDIESFIEYYKNPKNEAWNYRSDENGSSCLHILIHKDLFDVLYQVVNITEKNLNEENLKNYLNSTDKNGTTPFHLACFKGNMTLIKFLLKYDINYSVKTKTGLTCLHYSAQTNKVSPIYYMIKKYNMDKYIKDNKGNTFFHWACYCSSEKVIDFFLCDKDFNVNIKNKEEYIPLHYYLMSRNSRSIKKLIVRKADSYIKNKKGENAFDILNKIDYNNEINKNEIREILKRKYYYYYDFPFYMFISYHFVLIPFFILFEFPFFNLKSFFIIFFIYIIWIIFLSKSILDFLIKDPGIIKSNENDNYLIDLIDQDNQNNIDLSEYCIKCKKKRDPHTKHCFRCDKCIMEFDHHCLWLKTCVGKNNKKDFDILVILLLINVSFNFILSVLSVLNKKIVISESISTFFHLGDLSLIIIKIIKWILFIAYFFFNISIFFILSPLIKFIIDKNKKLNNINIQKTEYLIENPEDSQEETTNLLSKKK